MAFPYTVIGPGGQPYILSQIPIMQQPMQPQLIPSQFVQQSTQVQLQQQQQQQQQGQKQQQKQPDYMSEDKLQEKGTLKK